MYFFGQINVFLMDFCWEKNN